MEELSAGIDAGIRLEEADRAVESIRRSEVEDLVEKAGLPRAAVELAAGRPESVLEARAEAGDADLLIMGALSRAGRDLLIGSTAEKGAATNASRRAHGEAPGDVVRQARLTAFPDRG